MACFADVNVSQGSVATYARCGKIFNIKFNYKFTWQSPRENFYKIRLDFTELWPQICGPTFWPTLYVSTVGMRGTPLRPQIWRID